MIRYINLRLRAIIIFIGCVLALSMALTAEHVFGFMPCELCLIERLPFMAAGLMSMVALLFPPRPEGLLRVALGVAAVALFVNVGIAFYHVGVEQAWWLSSCGTSVVELDIMILDLTAYINTETFMPSCDAPAFLWNGISFALLNLFYSGFLGTLSFSFSLFRYQKRSVLR